jgi:D-alanine-D-alanine ligase
MLEMSEKAFKACGCRGVARVDFRYDGDKVYFLEINTQPGMTELSLVPDIARLNGMSLEDILRIQLHT